MQTTQHAELDSIQRRFLQSRARSADLDYDEVNAYSTNFRVIQAPTTVIEKGGAVAAGPPIGAAFVETPEAAFAIR